MRKLSRHCRPRRAQQTTTSRRLRLPVQRCAWTACGPQAAGRVLQALVPVRVLLLPGSCS